MEGWKKDNLGNLLELVYGKSLPKTKRADGNIPVYGSNGIVGFHCEAIVNEPGIIVGRKGSAGNIHFSKVPFFPIDTTFYITQQHSKLELDFLYLITFIKPKQPLHVLFHGLESFSLGASSCQSHSSKYLCF